MSKTIEAIEAFQAVQEEYAEFGALDTEPRTEFVLLLERVAEGKHPDMPVAGDDGWQLYTSMPGWAKANLALTKAAWRVVNAGREDREGLLTWLKDNYGYQPS